MKKSGILLPVSSLPGGAGIGDFGESALQWIDMLRENNVNIWQILPLNPIGYGNSPYQADSAFAGDEVYISLERLKEEGLITEELPDYKGYSFKVDYDGVRKVKNKYLYQAFLNYKKQGFSKGKYSEESFTVFKEQFWVKDYILFKEKIKRSFPKRKGEIDFADPKEYTEYIAFLQYIFYAQWMNIKNHANASGIQIMGDVPFYVGGNSAEVMFSPKNFLLKDNFEPEFIAGVPPDYFSTLGQRWGNPIYDWEYMQENDFDFWVKRMSYSAKLFDIVRVDHFRAFDTYWKIPAECPTAVEGEWVEAPGDAVLGKIIEAMGETELVAEDLGMMRKEVYELKDRFNLKGMKIFCFDYDFDGRYAIDINMPKDWSKVIYYTGTHDNETLKFWFKQLTTAAQNKMKKYLSMAGYTGGDINDRSIRFILESQAEYAIISMPDLLGCGYGSRINTPGTVGSPNWEWRMTGFDLAKKKLRLYRKYFDRG